ncbi:MAG TPA: YraN family protein, partial [Actinomycetota bacterium]|nr:YraN family protein [Actinomycetota bacterium]
MNGRSLLGHAAEGLACELLAGKGYEIVERNYRCADGEIDIIARRGSLVVFCEV